MAKLLAISGSLRHGSTNTALLKALASHVPAGSSMEIFSGLGELPIFNPDREGDATPQSVLDFARQIEAADGLVIACPEYAHGIPGGLKNALDWLVSRHEVPFKPVTVVRGSHRNDISHAALIEVLKTMSLDIFDSGFLLHLISKRGDALPEALQAPDAIEAMRTAMAGFVAWIEVRQG